VGKAGRYAMCYRWSADDSAACARRCRKLQQLLPTRNLTSLSRRVDVW